MELFKQVYGFNYLLSISLTGWLVAQVLKTLINGLFLGKFSLERMWGSGGMPSSHSATVCSLVVAAARLYGPDSAIFALAFIMAIIVMYDAMGVRRAAGEQAKVLNRMVIDFRMMLQMLKEEMDALARGESAPVDLENRTGKVLKEFLGHTPLEVLCGAALGILIAVLMPAF